MPDTNPIILFDGVCNLCAATVQFVLKRDKLNRFLFASLQSEAGRKLLERFGRKETQQLKSLVLIEDNKLYAESTAALRIARHLSAPWSLLYPLVIVPAFLRNGVYRWIAKNRYKWFGKKEECWLPSGKWQKRFLDQELFEESSR